MKRTWLLGFMLACSWSWAWADTSGGAPEIPFDATKYTLPELMSMKITSVSRKEENASKAAAAIHVITQEDIRRSGATSIPEALRMVPGLQVARIDSNKWVVASRGFSGRYASKLLVLMDGRSVYTPLFSGVYWEAQNVLLEDVERIEVIRGPGATLWGANAVNGVINIITKSAKDTEGGLLAAGGGNEEKGFGGLRYGGKAGEDIHYRVYGKYFNRDDFKDSSGAEGADAWDALHGGFRIDWDPSGVDSVTFQGDVHRGDAGHSMTQPILTPPYTTSYGADIDMADGNVLTRWRRVLSPRSDMDLQFYYDNAEYDVVGIGRSNIDTVDIDFHHRFPLGESHEMVWGLGYRFHAMKFQNTFAVSFDPDNRENHLLGAFAQDEITLIPDRLRLILGSKFEVNDYTGFEFQPNGRLLWAPHPKHTLWAAVSRAVRTPSWSEEDIRINLSAFPGRGGTPTLMSLNGNANFSSEELIAYEMGYRTQPFRNLSLDMAAFYNIYDNLLTAEPGVPTFETIPAPLHLSLPLWFKNEMGGETYGVEVVATWDATEYWRWTAGYAWLDIQLRLNESSGDTISELLKRESPHHQFHLRSNLDLPWNMELDNALYYVDALPSNSVPAYIRFDARLGWRLREDMELSLAGQNLFEKRHPEFVGIRGGINPTEVERGFYGKITWKF